MFVADTFICVKYGEAENMLEPNRGNPPLFRVTNKNMYILQSDGNILIFDKGGAFTARNKIPLQKANKILSIGYNDDGIVIIDLFKSYFLDNEFKLIDSVDYHPNCRIGQQFNIYENVYIRDIRDTSTSNTLIQFNVVHRLFSVVDFYSIWATKGTDFAVNPFPESFATNEYQFSGASPRIIILCNYGKFKKDGGITYSLYSSAGCKDLDLTGFNYDVNSTVNPWNAFQFINDTTAIFSVKYYDKSRVPPNSSKRVAPIERDCVFYRITFTD